MSNLGLFLVLVGPAAGLLLSTPRSPISAPLGKTALLSASLNFSASLPDYFQVRWRFVTRPRLVLIVKADNCQAENGTHRWLDACEISTEKAERYRYRAELATDDVSLILREVRLEDSGSYCITLLALGVKISANINLTVINEVDTSDTHDNGTTFDDQRRGIFPNKSTTVTAGGEAPASLVKVASDGDYTMSNIIQLSSAGLMLCLLGVIIAERIFSLITHRWSRKQKGAIPKMGVPDLKHKYRF